MDCDLTPLEIDDPAWTQFAATHPDATPFHRPEWARLIAECYGFRSGLLALHEDDGAIAAGLPIIEIGRRSRKRWVSLPFTDRCGPIATSAEAADELARRLEPMRRKLGLQSIEVRDQSAAPGWLTEQGYWHELELSDDPEAIFARFHRSTRGRVKRAHRDGVAVADGRSGGDLHDVFYGLHVATRRRLGVPVQPRRFFELLWEMLIARGLGFVGLARLRSVPIAAAVFLTANGRVTYKFSASDRRFARLGATHALLWWAIRRSCENGARRFDFGRTEAGNDGLRAFKLGWGASEIPLGYTFYASAPPHHRGLASHPGVKAVIRNSPPWLARAVGRAGYRFTA